MKQTVGEATESKSPVQSLDRAFDIIEALGNSGSGLSIASLCSVTGLHKSTIHRLLAAMKDRGYVIQDSLGTYKLSFKISLLSRQLIDGVSLVSVAKPHLKKLCDISQETVHLVLREDNCTVYLHREECLSSAVRVVSNVGLYRALHTSAVGKSIMATMTDGEIMEYWRNADKSKVTPYTLDDFDTLRQDVAETRLRGFAIDNEENTLGVRCMAVALENYLGNSDSAISISGPKDRMSDKRMQELKPVILNTRNEIMKGMGYVR